jgi:RimJ/RimL family protein N-acetyltransferase
MFARTQRLLLRPGWVDDAGALHQTIAHENVAMTLARLPWPYHLDDAQWFLSQRRGPRDAEFLIFARTDAEPKLIGGIGLQHELGATELGYWISPDHWGQGYATEAGKAVVDIARHALRLDGLQSGHFVDNPASGRVLIKLGFKPTGQVEPRHCLARNTMVPCVLYAQSFKSADEDGPSDMNDDDRTRPMMRLAA